MTSTDFVKVIERYCKRERLESPNSVASYDSREQAQNQNKTVQKSCEINKIRIFKKEKKEE